VDEVRLNCGCADVQRFADFAVTGPFVNQLQDFNLAAAEALLGVGAVRRCLSASSP
jgi:hypothetical protein